MPTERWTDEMLDRFASTVSVTLAGLGNAQIGLSQNVDGLTQNVNSLSQRVDSVSQSVDRLSQRVDQFITRTDGTIARLEQAIIELRAGQQQQTRVLDYLLKKEQRQNRGPQIGEAGTGGT